jgi:hypothetical protein
MAAHTIPGRPRRLSLWLLPLIALAPAALPAESWTAFDCPGATATQLWA